MNAIGNRLGIALNNSTIKTETGNDSVLIHGDLVNSTIHGGDGDDQILHAGGGNAELYGDEGNDTIIGGSGADKIFGGKGDDDIFAGDGGDTIDAGDGKDNITITGGKGISVTTGFGSDTIVFTADYYRSLLEGAGSATNIFEDEINNISSPLMIKDFTIEISEKEAIFNHDVAIRGDSIYTIVEGPTWEEAEANAQKLGGHLVTINDAEENDWLVDTFADINKGHTDNPIESDIYWIGLSKSTGAWQWESGENQSFTNWGPKEPWEDNGASDRAQIVVEAYPTTDPDHWIATAGNWNNAPNSYQHYGIAEINLETLSAENKEMGISFGDDLGLSLEDDLEIAIGGAPEPAFEQDSIIAFGEDSEPLLEETPIAQPSSNHDMMNFDDLLNNVAVNYDGSNAFATGHINLAQDGDNTLVSFDADGIAGDKNTGVVIATLQNVNTSDLSTGNIDSDYSLEGGLDPITGTAETQSEEGLTTITAETTDAIINPSNDLLAKSPTSHETDSMAISEAINSLTTSEDVSSVESPTSTTSQATSSTDIVTAAIASAVDQNTI
ncbi:Hemolysin, chromosomal [Prochlorococcus marinus str. MIT 1320]|nr:Hemolysin, chromosomal [Prochlorococcus marinus str. MIT 1320]